MPISLKNMRGCASTDATAICTSISTTSTAAAHRPIHHRLNSYLTDQYKNLATHPTTITAPCISELPFNPRPRSAAYRKSSSLKKHFSDTGGRHQDSAARRNSSAEVTDYLRRRKSSADIRDVLRRGPLGSSSCRYLLSDTASFREDLLEHHDSNNNPLALVLSEPVEDEEDSAVGSTGKLMSGYQVGKRDDMVQSSPVSRRDLDRSRALVPSQTVVNPDHHGSTGNGRPDFYQRTVVKSSLPPARPAHQVVVLRVSLHCKGCEGKLRKHLSKMEGVTSFSIDLETKKVTVIGNVTPLYVLNSISKVKNAQFWPSPAVSTSSSASCSSSSASTKSEFSC